MAGLIAAVSGLHASDDQFIVLSDTGARRDGLPVLKRHPAPEPWVRALKAGYSGRLLRLYSMVQRFARPGHEVEPAYLLLSDNEGGFPRFGFYLDDVRHEGTGYVDLHQKGAISGRSGAMDQIFPHELLHVIVHHLAGEPPSSGANQVHAVGVRTDVVTAFNEGFAEHAQVMAVDDPQALADTREAMLDPAAYATGRAHLERYRRSLTAHWALAPRAQLTFPVWFSRTEQILRYHAVRANLFAHETDIPERLFQRSGVYKAYLLENVLPGEEGGKPKRAPRLLATEGVASNLFVRLVTDRRIQASRRDEAFYGRFAPARPLDGLENAYLKLFAAIAVGKYSTADVLRAYGRLFPEDVPARDEIVRETLLGQPLPDAPEIWIWNDTFSTGTTLFDQLRGLPRSHTFDLNAASRADLASVPGMTLAAADAIIAASPFEKVEDVARVTDLDRRVVETLTGMHQRFAAQQAADAEEQASLSIRSILLPYLWRALAALVGTALIASFAFRALGGLRWWRCGLNGLAVAFCGLVVGWSIDPGTGFRTFIVPLVLFGLPAAAISFWRSRSERDAARALGTWALAAALVVLVVTPIG